MKSAWGEGSTFIVHLPVLDVMLPRMSEFDALRELRRRGVETPVILLTARG